MVMRKGSMGKEKDLKEKIREERRRLATISKEKERENLKGASSERKRKNILGREGEKPSLSVHALRKKEVTSCI